MEIKSERKIFKKENTQKLTLMQSENYLLT